MSIKACTIQRVIEGREVPLPSNWSSFFALSVITMLIWYNFYHRN